MLQLQRCGEAILVYQVYRRDANCKEGIAVGIGFCVQKKTKEMPGVEVVIRKIEEKEGLY
mgnify:FL=1